MIKGRISSGLRRSTKSQYLVPPIIIIAVLYYFYRLFIIPNEVLTGDIAVPYPLPFIVQLSYSTPWYNLFSTFVYLNSYSIYGYLMNSLEIFLFVPAYFSMYLLLAELRIRKIPAVLLSIFYLLNPVVFPMVFTYTNLIWPELFIFAPLFLLFLLRYEQTGKLMNQLMLAILISFYLEIQTSPTLFNIRLVIPIIALPYLYVLVKKILKRDSIGKILKDYLTSITLFTGLNIPPILQMIGYATSVNSFVSSVGSAFQSFHYNNVIYTYQSQNPIFAISGLVVYPSAQNSFLQGAGQLFFPLTLFFDAIVITATLAPLIVRRQNNGFIKSISVSVLAVWIFISLVKLGVILPLFTRFPLLYLWEYPSYLEMTLIVLYIPLLAVLLNGLLNLTDISSNYVAEAKKHKKRFPEMRNAKNSWKKFLPFIVIILLFSYFIPIAYTDPGGFSSVPQYDTQQPMYHNLYNFFKDKIGEYKVMIVPFNETTYKELVSALPSSEIFGLPYAYQNNPSAFANASLFHSIYYDIGHNEMHNFTDLVNQSGVKYIIVLNGIDGGWIQEMQSLLYLNLIQRTSSYSVFKYIYFPTVKVVAEPYIINNKGTSTSSNYSTEIGRNSNFTNITGYSPNHPFVPYWGEWNGNLPYGVAFNYSVGKASIGVFGNTSSKGRQLSEIYQRVLIPPGAILKVIVHIVSQENSNSSIFVIAHRNTSKISAANFFSPFANYSAVPRNAEYVYYCAVPRNAEYVYFGVIVWNYSAGNGYLNLSSLSLSLVNEINFSGYLSIIQNTLPFPTIEYDGTMPPNVSYNSIIPVIPGAEGINISKGNWTYINNTGIGILNSTISVNVPPHSQFIASVELLSNSSIISNGDQHNGSIVHVFVNATASAQEIAFGIKGSAIIQYMVIIRKIQENHTQNITLSIDSSYEIVSTSNDSGALVTVYAPFDAIYTTNGQVKALFQQEINGMTVSLYYLSAHSNLTVTFLKPELNTSMIVFNLISFCIMLFAMVFYPISSFRRHH